MTTATDINAAFQWKCQPEAEALILSALEEFKAKNPRIATFERDLLAHTSTRLFDWVDHIVLGYSPTYAAYIEKTGYVAEYGSANYRVYRHPGAQLPSIVLNEQPTAPCGVAVSVESIADFLMVRGMSGWIEGSLYSGYRRCEVWGDGGVSLWVVERRGSRSMEPIYCDEHYTEKYLEALEKWQSRPRAMEDQDEAISLTLNLAKELIAQLGQDLTAWLVLDVERRYWQSRNLAGQLQKDRQDRLGMGWANHDHHTFRSSRRHFPSLVRLFEMLGFFCRERYYTGKEAGWGAQIMENPRARLILFLDVDLAPDEITIDFAHQPIPDLPAHRLALGTIGLWCELHGDSILKAGMHHLEAQFMFDALKADLSHKGVGMMDPFSDFPYLKQAFTAGEIWHVDPKRIEALLSRGLITKEQAEKFQRNGAVGSHLENLQRREGYKGFNQKNVSLIITKTDPRKL
jgi:hypothetical protein